MPSGDALGIRASALVIAVCCAAAGFLTIARPAQAGPSSYNIDTLLYQPYPLAAAVDRRDFADAPVPQSQIYPPARFPPPDGAPAYPARSAAAPSMAEIRPPVAPVPPMLAEESGGVRSGIARYLSEIRVGALAHDEGPFGRHKESGTDGNIEFLFVSPDFLRLILAPRPQLGVSVNSDGNTSSAYFGLNWEWNAWRGLFLDFSFGGMAHNGFNRTNILDRKELGCHLLFRESLEAGWRFAGRHSLSFLVDHSSNGRLCSKNEGLNDLGVRYGYTF